jgi:hypothetical protein
MLEAFKNTGCVCLLQVVVSRDSFSTMVYVKLCQISVFKLINNVGRLWTNSCSIIITCTNIQISSTLTEYIKYLEINNRLLVYGALNVIHYVTDEVYKAWWMKIYLSHIRVIKFQLSGNTTTDRVSFTHNFCHSKRWQMCLLYSKLVSLVTLWSAKQQHIFPGYLLEGTSY